LIEEEELALARRKRHEKARLKALRLDEEAAIALATAKAIDEELNESGLDVYKEFHAPELLLASPNQRVREYLEVQKQSSSSAHDDVTKRENPERTGLSEPKLELKQEPVTQPEVLSPSVLNLNMPTPASPSNAVMVPYVECMARRELISNKIEKFDDRPENFHSWKGSFHNMIRGVNLSPSEQLSLIIENTTNESKRLVQRLSNAYIENPGKGLNEVWLKLGERFGSNAVVTQVHLEKLRTFPKIGNRENKQLQEFGDLLLELQCAKNDGGLRGLKILDEPAYLRSAVAKLSNDLQSKGDGKDAFKYKGQHDVAYPPVDEFSDFIRAVSREKNDPYLTMENVDKPTHSPTESSPLKPPFSPGNTRQRITPTKTEITETELRTDEETPIVSDPSK